jgi:hypothetical protein
VPVKHPDGKGAGQWRAILATVNSARELGMPATYAMARERGFELAYCAWYAQKGAIRISDKAFADLPRRGSSA